VRAGRLPDSPTFNIELCAVRKLLLILTIPAFAFTSKAQRENCILKSPRVTIHFGAGGEVSASNNMVPGRYTRVNHYCPQDGFYAFTSHTSGCFRDDWHTLGEDHTPGDVNGNMLLINSSPSGGAFFKTTVEGLKPATRYEFSTWMINVCRITDKCPFPLLPDITIRLQTLSGKVISQLSIGEVARVKEIRWSKYNFMFTMPASETSVEILMVNHNPGGCGNDFAMDDITFRECVPPPPKKPVATSKPDLKKAAPVIAKKPALKIAKSPAKKPVAKKPAAKQSQPATAIKKPIGPVIKDTVTLAPPEVKKRPPLPAPPRVLTSRTNALVKVIEAEAGNIEVNLFDNGEIDGDTVSIYHNNRLIVSKALLSQKAVTVNININKGQPHHELVMVAENLGSIPPNTALMIVSAGSKKHEVFISSTKQKNAKVVLDLKQ
jgi:hypothetical protein